MLFFNCSFFSTHDRHHTCWKCWNAALCVLASASQDTVTSMVLFFFQYLLYLSLLSFEPCFITYLINGPSAVDLVEFSNYRNWMQIQRKHQRLVFNFFMGRHKRRRKIKKTRAGFFSFFLQRTSDGGWATRKCRAYKMHDWAACFPDTWLFLSSLLLPYFTFYPFASPPRFSPHIPLFSPSLVLFFFYLCSPDCALTLQSSAPLINSLSWGCRWQ